MKKIKKSLPLDQLKKTLRETCSQSGAILNKYFNKKLHIKEKKNAGLVTEADVESEEAAIKVLRKAYPGCSILAEESGETNQSKSIRFIIDPLDGTTNFVHRFPMFCVTVAAEWEGEIVAAATYHPILDQIWEAQLGRGTTLNDQKISVSKTKEIKNSLLTTGFTYRKVHQLKYAKTDVLHMEIQVFEKLSRISRAIRRPGSAALDLAYVASGVFDGFWERSLSPWDTAAGFLLVKEAGGIVTDFSGQDYHISKNEILASTTGIHCELREIIAPEFCLI